MRCQERYFLVVLAAFGGSTVDTWSTESLQALTHRWGRAAIAHSNALILQVTEAKKRTAAARARMDAAQASIEVFDELEHAHEEIHEIEEHLKIQADALADAAEELQAERRLVWELFEDAPAAYLTTDVSGRIHEANREAEQLLGAHRSSLRGERLVHFVETGDHASMLGLIAKAVKASSAVRDEIVFRTGDAARPCRASVSLRASTHDAAVTLRWIFVETTPTEAVPEELVGELLRELRTSIGTALEWQKVLRQRFDSDDETRRAVGKLAFALRVMRGLIDKLAVVQPLTAVR